MEITLQQLRELEACEDQAKLFEATFGDAAELTVENADRAVEARLNTDWLASRTLTASAREEYERVEAHALAEYDRVEAHALAECRHVTAAARAKYDRATVAAWAKYVRVEAHALAEYERVRDAAWAEYQRTCGQEYVRLMNADGAK